MSKIQCPPYTPMPGLREVWSAARLIASENGIDAPALIAGFTKSRREFFDEKSAGLEFEVLCRTGCQPTALAISTFAPEVFRFVAHQAEEEFGNARTRPRNARQLLSTSEMLRSTLSEGDLVTAKMNPFTLRAPPGMNVTAVTVQYLGLRAKATEFVDLFAKHGGIHSPQDIARFVLTKYVHLATGRWRDKEVSALLQACVGEVYDETAHKMWRNRNFSRLDRHYCVFGELLQEIGDLIASST